MDGVSTALYIDFDNVFSGLHKLDPVAAMTFVERPRGWLGALSSSFVVDGPRRWAVRRCYINSTGSIKRTGLDPLAFSAFPDLLTKAGFEVVDCPPYFKGAKNAADIKMVLDVVDALHGPTRYDEFVIASGDSDFTPLLVKIRAADRRTTLISTVKAAKALTAVADRAVDGQQMLGLVLAPDGRAGGPLSPPASKAAEEAVLASQAKGSFGRLVRKRYTTAKGPLSVAQLAKDLKAELGPVVTETRWFGYGSFSRAVQSLTLPNMRMSEGFLWDSTRHKQPRKPKK